MLRNSFLLTLAISLLLVGVRPALATPQEKDEARRAAKAKADVAKRGVGEKAKIRVEMRDKTEVKGYISQTGDDNFVIADAKTGAKTTVAYRDVAHVKGKGLSTGAKIGIGVGIAAVAIGIVIAAAAKSLGDLH